MWVGKQLLLHCGLAHCKFSISKLLMGCGEKSNSSSLFWPNHFYASASPKCNTPEEPQSLWKNWFRLTDFANPSHAVYGCCLLQLPSPPPSQWLWHPSSRTGGQPLLNCHEPHVLFFSCGSCLLMISACPEGEGCYKRGLSLVIFGGIHRPDKPM